MPQPDFAVTPETLRVVASSLADESRHLDQVLGALSQRVGSLEENWDGAARDAYATAQRDWTAALDDIRSILGRIAQSTRQMADGYADDDVSAAAHFTHQQLG
jgi:WXG100 family type VII secretion target